MGKITKIETQKNNVERANIFIDEDFAFGCDMELIYKLRLKKGDVVDNNNIEEILKKEDFSKCKSQALRSVTRGYKTEKEIRDKLTQKEFQDSSIEKTIDFLKEYKFIDDDKFALMFSKDKSYNQGRNKIKYALKRKGIDDTIIEKSLSTIDEEDEHSKALELGKKKYSILEKRENDKRKLYQKMCNYLIGRGYEYSLVKKVVNEIISGIEEEV